MKDTGKTIIVSGGSKGLGKSIITDLLNSGHNVATFSRSKTDFIEELERGERKKQILWCSVDISNSTDVEQFAKNTIKKFGGIDVLINNAAIAREGIITLLAEQEISSMIDINIKGSVYLTRACVKHMILKKSGNIINISSIVGQRGYSGLSVYSATKAALFGLTRSLARELGGQGIRVNAIAPGYMETDMSNTLSDQHMQQIIRRTPLGRLGMVEDVAGVVQFLISRNSSFITGQTITVDGGINC